MVIWKTDSVASDRPVLLEWRSSKAFTIFVVTYAVSLDMLLYGLIVPVAPTALTERVGLSQAGVQKWTSILLSLYGATLLITGPIAGYIADRIDSRRLPFLAGLTILAIATALLAVGSNLALWIAGRLFQGAAAAIVWTVGMALLADNVGVDEMGRAMGYIAMGMTMGSMAGPLLGGTVYEHAGYHVVFGLAFAFIGLDIIFRVILIEKKDAAKWLSSDDTSTQTDTSAPDTISMNDIETQTPDDHPPSHKPSSPLLTLLHSRRMAISLFAYFALSLNLSCFDSVLPLFVQSTFAWNQRNQGLIFLPLSLPHLLNPLTGYTIDHHPKTRHYLSSGPFLLSIPVLVSLRFVTENTTHDKVLLCALLALIAVLMGMVEPPIMVEISAVIRVKEKEFPGAFGKGGAVGLGYGLMNTAWAAGLLVGPIYGGFIRDVVGWGTMGWALGVLMGVAGGLMGFLI